VFGADGVRLRRSGSNTGRFIGSVTIIDSSRTFLLPRRPSGSTRWQSMCRARTDVVNGPPNATYGPLARGGRQQKRHHAVQTKGYHGFPASRRGTRSASHADRAGTRLQPYVAEDGLMSFDEAAINHTGRQDRQPLWPKSRSGVFRSVNFHEPKGQTRVGSALRGMGGTSSQPIGARRVVCHRRRVCGDGAGPDLPANALTKPEDDCGSADHDPLRFNADRRPTFR